MNNLTSIAPATAAFGGETVEDVREHVFTHGNRALVVECRWKGTSFVEAGTQISWLTDDNGRRHFAVADSAGGFEYAGNIDEAWETAVAFACNVIDPEYPADLAYDERIPAKVHGTRADLEAQGLPKA